VDPFVDWEEMMLLTQKIIDTVPSKKKYHDGGGLYFYKSSHHKGKWSFRFTRNGRAQEMGLGSYPAIGLKAARTKSGKYRCLHESGINPLEDRKNKRLQQKYQQANRFSKMAEIYFSEQKEAWKNLKHRKQWIQTLRTYAFPKLDKKPLSELTTDDFHEVLKPIWYTKNETARRLQQRMQRVMSWSITKRLYHKDKNPAQWVQNLEFLLMRSYTVQTPRPHPSLRWQDIPSFYAELSTLSSMSALALRFLILTIGRTSEILGCQRSEINREKKTWTLSERRMKKGIAHTVPLSSEAMEIIDTLWQKHNHAYIFPSNVKPNTPLSNMAMLNLMKRHFSELHVVPHGFRSSFRMWSEEVKPELRNAAEITMAHKIRNPIEGAYMRSDLLDQRRDLLEEWAHHVSKDCKKDKIC
jgi:integrase